MTEITWTNCADKMPPNNATKVIWKNEFNEIHWTIGSVFHDSSNVRFRFKWTPYTDEKWKELTQQCGKCGWWDRSDGARIDTSFTRPQQVKSKCQNASSKHYGKWCLSINDGYDCPVYEERKECEE